MKPHGMPIFCGLAILLGACSAMKSPTAVADSHADAVNPRHGVMYGSGNRTDGDEGENTSGSQDRTQNTAAADSGEMTARIAGGVMYGSGN